MLAILYEVNHDYDYNYDAALPSAITQIRQTKIYMDLDGDWFARVIFEVTWPANIAIQSLLTHYLMHAGARAVCGSVS